jgi:hypothetical protein
MMMLNKKSRLLKIFSKTTVYLSPLDMLMLCGTGLFANIGPNKRKSPNCSASLFLDSGNEFLCWMYLHLKKGKNNTVCD